MPLAAMALVVSAHFVLAGSASAQSQMEFIPSVSLFTIYDDNVFARVDGSAGQMLQLRPSFEGSYQSPTVRLLGLYSFDMQRSNFSSLNTLDARRHALGETRLRPNPFTTLGLALRYDRSETPGEIDLDTGVLGERRQAERLEVNPSFARRLNPRTALTGAYGWTTEYLVDGERGTLHIGRAGLSRDISTKTTLTSGYVGRFFVDHQPPTVNRQPTSDHRSHAALFGWNRVLAPGTRVTFVAGPKTTTYGGVDLEATAAFARATTRMRLGLDYWHGETIVLGIAGPVAVDSVTSRVTWPLTPRFELATHAGVSDVATLDDRASTIYRGTLVGSWSSRGLYTIAATYGVDFQNGSIRNRIYLDDEALLPLDDRVLRHVFRVSVTVAPRYRRSILPPEEAARAKGVSR